MKRYSALGVLACAVCLSVGCGGNDLPLIPVRGKVTFNGGPCPRPGRISFVPDRESVSSDLPYRPAWARFHEDGQFEATSFQEGDGLLPGKYYVKISCLTAPPDASNPNWREDNDLVPQDYRPPELVVEPGQRWIEVNFDVPPKK